jgi:hypothetical protein
MSQNITDMPGIEAAMERFDTLTGSNDSRALTPDTREIVQADAQPAAECLPRSRGADDAAQNSDSNPTSGFAKATPDGARAAADSANSPESASPGPRGAQSNKTEDPGQGTQDPALAPRSRYAKAKERLEKTWEAVNKRKGELDSQAQQIEQQRLDLERDKAQFEAVRRQAEQPQATPEQALQAMQLRRRDADALRMQAKRSEEAGRIDEAHRLNKQADRADGLADDLAEYAEQLRKNPPLSMQQRQQQFEQARKQWTLEACNAFPELGKSGSALQQVVARHLNALAKQDPHLLAHPSLIYHVARLADTEIKAAGLETAAARVPVLEKETESLRARIKELEASVTPAAGGGVPRLDGELKDDATSLRQMAAELGHGRW